MDEIAKLALKVMRNVQPSCEFSEDVVLFIMTAIVGWVKTNRIMSTWDFPEYKIHNIYALIEEIYIFDISLLVDEFLAEGSNDNV